MGIPIIGDIIDAVGGLVSEVVIDKDKRDQVNLELAKIKDQAEARLDAQLQAQIDVNKTEAQHSSIFVAGWRPAIGWVGAAALAYSFILTPFIGIWVKELPAIQYEYLMTIVTAMLGVGGMRTFEKVKGVATSAVQMQATKPVPQAPAPQSSKQEPLRPPKKPHRWQKI